MFVGVESNAFDDGASSGEIPKAFLCETPPGFLSLDSTKESIRRPTYTAMEVKVAWNANI